MTPYQYVIYAMIAIFGLVTVRTRDPKMQLFPYSFYGMLLAVLFMVNQAPDVALSVLAVGSALVPFLVLIALSKIKARENER